MKKVDLHDKQENNIDSNCQPSQGSNTINAITENQQNISSQETNAAQVNSDSEGNQSSKNNKLNLTTSLENNISAFRNILTEDEMLVTRRFQNKYMPEVKCCVIFYREMVNRELINENIIEPLLNNDLTEGICAGNLLEELEYKVLIANNIEKKNDVYSLIESMLEGDTVFLLDGFNEALVISSKGWQTRAITEPQSSRVVRGPREGFTESINLNISLLRRKIKSSDLKFKFKNIGETTHTSVCISYLVGIASKEILKELEKRLDKIKIDGILDSGYIQELIRDAPFSPLETVGYTERPDIVAARLLEGRIAILVDGSPNVLTVPYVFVEVGQASEDYYNNYIYSSIIRFTRVVGIILSISVPSFYLALATFHQEMLPTPLLVSIAAGRQGVPFPTVASLIIMLGIFDLLREASVRMPAPISQAMNIVGTLILGQALAEAKLVSPVIIIITAITGILSLLNITLIGAIMVYRTLLLIATSILGIYGFLLAFILLIIHMMNIRSFGIPYMLNISRVKEHNFQDAWIRAPWWEMTLRPKLIATKNLIRQSPKGKKGK